MTENSPNLNLPYIAASQAQKHITHNEAIKLLDILVQMSVVDILTTPPANPNEGDNYIVGLSAINEWLNKDNQIASYQDGAWTYFIPNAGWLVYSITNAELLSYSGALWSSVAGDMGTVTKLGINATADNINRLSLKNEASLLDNVGQGHQCKVNKANVADTASLLFQTGYSGRAEMGLAGDDDFRIKTSPDGSVWNDAMTLDANTGVVNVNQGISLNSGADILKIYDVGFWTPELYGVTTAGTPTYNYNIGKYVRIGDFVIVTCRIVWTSLGGAAGHIRFKGLPFTIKSGHENRAAISISWYNSLSLDAGVTTLGGFGEPGNNYIKLWGADTPRNDSNNLLSDADLSQYGEMYFNMSYIAQS